MFTRNVWYGLLVILAIPQVVFAQTLGDFLGEILFILGALMPVIVGLAVLFFLWGLAQYILNADNKDVRAQASKHMVMGIFVIFIMLSVWGIVAVISNTLDLDNTIPVAPLL